MRIARSLILLLPLASLTLLESRMSGEPPLDLVLEVDGREIPVRLGQPFEVKTGAGKTRMVLRARETRLLERAGVSFRYPFRFVYEEELDGPVSTWTIEGSDVTIILQSLPRLMPEAMIRRQVEEETEGQYKGMELLRSDVTLELGEDRGSLPGVRFEVDIAGQAIVQEMFLFPAGGAFALLILQDSPGDRDHETQEMAGVREMVRQSLQIRDEV